jgi:hypothetical protein
VSRVNGRDHHRVGSRLPEHRLEVRKDWRLRADDLLSRACATEITVEQPHVLDAI